MKATPATTFEFKSFTALIELLLVMAASSLAPVAFGAAPGEPDPAFSVPIIAGGFPTTVRAVTTQPDGKILFGGNFTNVWGVARTGLARLNADGSLDTTFIPATNVPPDVRTLAIQPDGRILVGIGYPSSAVPSVIRLEADGKKSAGFLYNAAYTPHGALALLLQPDGKILVGGGTLIPSAPLLRFLSTGALDLTFVPPPNVPSLPVEAMAWGTDGRVFTAVGFDTGALEGGLFRLGTNGLRAPFTFNVSPSFVAYAVAVQPDGQVIVGGAFTKINAAGRTNIARISPTGTPDSTFNAGLGPNGTVRSIVLQPDNQVLVAGDFTTFNGWPCAGVARLQTNGVLDTGFSPAAGLGLSSPVLALQEDGLILVGGSSPGGHPLVRLLGGDSADTAPTAVISPEAARLTAGQSVTFEALVTSLRPVSYQWLRDGQRIPGATHAMLARTNVTADMTGTYTVAVTNAVGHSSAEASLDVVPLSLRVGRLDTSYNTGTRAQVMDGLFALALQPDGSAVLGGGFQSFNGVARTNLVRVDALGNVDTNFNAGLLTYGNYPNWVQSLVRQPDGKLLCGGSFARHLFRLTSEGTLDTSFVSAFGAPAYALALQDDGRALVGSFLVLQRLRPTGTSDNSFLPGPAPVRAIVVQPDGKILAGGDFTVVSGAARQGLVRLNPGGDVDFSFDARMWASSKVSVLLLQDDGRMFVGGAFTFVGGAARKGLARLNPDGSVDPTFDIGTGFVSAIPTVVAALALQPDGKLLVGGGFTGVDGVSRRAIVRLNPDGQVDPTFNPGTGADGPVYAMALQPDGNVIIAGDFNHVDGQPRDRLARLFGDHPPPLAPRIGVPAFATGQALLSFPSELGRTFTLEFTDILGSAQWTPTASVLGDGSLLTLADTNALSPKRFYRLRAE